MGFASGTLSRRDDLSSATKRVEATCRPNRRSIERVETFIEYLPFAEAIGHGNRPGRPEVQGLCPTDQPGVVPEQSIEWLTRVVTWEPVPGPTSERPTPDRFRLTQMKEIRMARRESSSERLVGSDQSASARPCEGTRPRHGATELRTVRRDWRETCSLLSIQSGDRETHPYFSLRPIRHEPRRNQAARALGRPPWTPSCGPLPQEYAHGNLPVSRVVLQMRLEENGIEV